MNIFCKYILFFILGIYHLSTFSYLNAQSHCSDLYGCQDENSKIKLPNYAKKCFSTPQLSDETKVMKCTQHFDKLYSGWGSSTSIEQSCKDIKKFKRPIFIDYEILDCDSQSFSKEHFEETKSLKQKKQKKITTIISQRKKEENRGKWGINFAMKEEEVDCGSKDFVAGCYFNGVIVSFENIGGVSFVSSFQKNFGEFTVSKYEKLRDNLLSKYKSVSQPSSSDWDLWSRRDLSLYMHDTLNHVFENIKNNKEPKYIILSVFSVKSNTNISVRYVNESYGRELVKEKIMKDEYMDDL